MAEIKSYQDLIAWQKAYALGKTIYNLASTLPDAERFGLVSSLRRTAISVASHIAQGYGRGVRSEYIWFLKQARSELYALDTHLMFARDFRHIPDEEYDRVTSELDEAERVLAGLIRSLDR